jgi:SNF2 family DNA or RNA helicase
MATQWTCNCPGGKIKADVYRGKQRDKLLAGINNGWLETLLVSYETLRMDFCLLNAVGWSCVIFDEVHRLKRTSSLSLPPGIWTDSASRATTENRSKLTTMCMDLNTRRRFGTRGLLC